MADEEVVENEVTEESTEEPTDDLRGLLEEAFDEPEETPTEAAAAGAEQAAEGDAKDSGNAAAADGGSESGEPAAAVAAEDLTPPIDWDAELREQWAGLAEPVRKKIADREAQMAQAMQGTAQARQIAGEVGQIANQYGSVMAAEGVQNPVQMFQGVMQTVAELRMGSPQQKANKMAEIFETYGVDLKELDRALSARISGKPAADAPATDPNIEQMLDQRLAPVNQMMQQLAGMQQQRQIASQQGAMEEVNQFAANHEFLNDVRHDVADLMDLATRQGREITLEDAYNKACAMNPQISAVLAKRAEQEQLAQASQNVGRKKAAASSLAPGNLAGNASSGGDSLAGALNAAWDEQLGR